MIRVHYKLMYYTNYPNFAKYYTSNKQTITNCIVLIGIKVLKHVISELETAKTYIYNQADMNHE